MGKPQQPELGRSGHTPMTEGAASILALEMRAPGDVEAVSGHVLDHLDAAADHVCVQVRSGASWPAAQALEDAGHGSAVDLVLHKRPT